MTTGCYRTRFPKKALSQRDHWDDGRPDKFRPGTGSCRAGKCWRYKIPNVGFDLGLGFHRSWAAQYALGLGDAYGVLDLADAAQHVLYPAVDLRPGEDIRFLRPRLARELVLDQQPLEFAFQLG